MKRARPSLLADSTGSTVVEAAFALPAVLMILFSVVDLVQVTFMRLSVQQYANSGASIAAMSGSSAPTDSQIINRIAADNGISQGAITITRWTECNQSPQGNVGNCPNTSDPRADYLKVAVQGSYSPLLLNSQLGGWVPATSYTAYSTARIR